MISDSKILSNLVNADDGYAHIDYWGDFDGMRIRFEVRSKRVFSFCGNMVECSVFDGYDSIQNILLKSNDTIKFVSGKDVRHGTVEQCAVINGELRIVGYMRDVWYSYDSHGSRIEKHVERFSRIVDSLNAHSFVCIHELFFPSEHIEVKNI